MAISVEELCAAGRAAWPDIDVPREQLATYLAARIDADPAHAADLYLACACIAGHAAALAAFHARFLTRIEEVLGSLADGGVDDIRQELAVKLLVATDDQPARLAGYTGKGPLGGWVRVAATRLAIDLRRRNRREQVPADLDSFDRLAEAVSVELAPEVLLLRDHYRAAFRTSLQDALSALEPFHRAVLRLHYLEGMTTAALAAVYSVSRNTIVRRIADARTALFEATIHKLTAQVGLPADQYQTLLELVRSQLEISVARLLANPSV